MTMMMTGFPGFLGSALPPRILERTGGDAVCLVQSQYAAEASRRLDQLAAQDRSLLHRVRLVDGDITRPGLGLPADGSVTDDVTEVWHLAAVYDLAVARDLAVRVNVAGTRNVLDAIAPCPKLERFHYFSTCFVSGRYPGAWREDDLDEPGPFNNFYEETKHLAEVEVRRRMADGLPATIYRPSVVVGDSVTGATQKYDGPYVIMQWLLRQPRVAVLPMTGDPTLTCVNVVPRDFVIDAVARLSALPASAGRAYQLADPRPLPVDGMVDVLAEATGRRVVRVRVPRRLAKGAIRHGPGINRLMRIPAEAVDYFTHPTAYLTDHVDEDLAGSGIEVPRFDDYAPRLVSFMRAHPEIGSRAMV
ncbi:MAG: SDR family oxidoreductase [Acidimicrobiales bacterium]